MKLSRSLAVALLALAITNPALAGTTTITGKDATGATVTMGAVDNGAGGPKSATHGMVDSTATEVTNPTRHSVVVEGVSGGTAVKVDGSAVTQPVSAGSLPLPSGASTAAKQPALGTAGTPSADVLTVQGATSMTALKVDGSATTQPVSGTVSAAQSGTWNVTNVSGTVSLPTGAATATNQSTEISSLSTIATNSGTQATAANQTTANSSLSTIATNSGTQATAANQTSIIGTKAPGTAATNALLAGCVYNSAGVTLTTAQQAACQFDANGFLKVNVAAGGAGGGAVTAASGAYAAGAFAAGAGVDGWDLTEGAKADTAWTGSGSGSVIAILKYIGSSVNGAIPAGTSVIGKVGIDQTTDGTTNAVHLVAGTALAGKFGIDQTTPGTTNGVQDAATSATGSAVPSKAIYNGVVSGGNLVGLIQADSSAAINVSTATTTQLVALSSGKKIYVTAFDVMAGGTGNITYVYGTGSNCGTGTTSLTGAYNLTAQAGVVKGNGLGPVLVVPASNALCVTTSQAVQMSGSVAYTQF